MSEAITTSTISNAITRGKETVEAVTGPLELRIMIHRYIYYIKDPCCTRCIGLSIYRETGDDGMTLLEARAETFPLT